MDKKQNILMVMVDQFRADWLGCAGTDYVKTPNIDRIASRGIRFENAVCNSPLCTPSRGSMTAGVYPHRLGMLSNFANFPIDQPTVYQALRRSGYRVGIVGKTDLHKYDTYYGEDGDNPVMYHWGFTDPHETIGKMAVASYRDEKNNCPYKKYLLSKGRMDDIVDDYTKRIAQYSKNPYPLWYSAQSVLATEDNHESYIGRKACEFLNNISDASPWHLFVSFVGPHDPWDSPKEYYELYKDKIYLDSIQDNLEGKPEWVKKRSRNQCKGMQAEDLNKVKQHYAGMIAHIDDWVGKILDILEQRNLVDNTTVIFCSDHGEMMGDHGLFQKTTMYEASLRIPLIISDPRHRHYGTCDALAELVDLYPTLLDIAEIEYDSKKTDGKSLLSLIKGTSDKHKQYQFSELEHCRMVFDGKYKFIESHNDKNELYDLEEDPFELNNLIDAKPDLAKEMIKIMRGLRK